MDPGCGSPLADMLYPIKGACAYHSGQTTDTQSVGVRALDDRTLEVELEQPTSYFLYLVANQACYPLPRHIFAAKGPAWAEPEGLVGNGAFVLQAWQQQGNQQGEIHLVRNPRYHGRFLGNLSEVVLCAHPTPARRLEMYREADTLLIKTAVLMPFKYLRSHFQLKPWVKRFPVSAIGWWYLSEVILETDQSNKTGLQS